MENQCAVELGTLKGHLDRIWGVSISPDGRWVCSCGADGYARIYKVDGKKFDTEAFYQSLYIEPTNTKSLHNDISDDDEVNDDGATRYPTLRACAFNADSNRLVLGCYDAKAYVFSLYKTKNTGREFWCLYGELISHQKEIKSVAFSRNGRIATCSRDKFVMVWREEQIPIQNAKAKPDGDVDIEMEVDESTVEEATSNEVILHPAITSEYTLTGTLEAHLGDIKTVSFSQDSNFLLSGSYDNILKLYKRCIDETGYTFGLGDIDQPDEDWYPFTGTISSQKADYFLNSRKDIDEITKGLCNTVWCGRFIGNEHIATGDASGVLRLFKIDKTKADLNQVAVSVSVHEFGRPIYGLAVDWCGASNAVVFSVSSDNSLAVTSINVPAFSKGEIITRYAFTPLIKLTKVADGEINAVDAVKIANNTWMVALGGDDSLTHLIKIDLNNLIA